MLSLFRKKKIERVKIADRSVTETLAKAMELADKMTYVIVIYETREEEEITGGVIASKNATFSKINWMLDLAKQWVFE